jgi:hypothetical protein
VHVQDLGWARVTDPLRTATEIASRAPFVEGLISADSALRQLGHRGPGVGGERIQAIAHELQVRRGARRVERVAAFADGHAESAGESWTRAVLAHLGVPPPDLQVDILDGGLWLARVDFCWPERRIVLEFDGEKKYRAALRSAGRSVEDVVIEEKKREDRLRAAGWTVVRLRNDCAAVFVGWVSSPSGDAHGWARPRAALRTCERVKDVRVIARP